MGTLPKKENESTGQLGPEISWPPMVCHAILRAFVRESRVRLKGPLHAAQQLAIVALHKGDALPKRKAGPPSATRWVPKAGGKKMPDEWLVGEPKISQALYSSGTTVGIA